MSQLRLRVSALVFLLVFLLANTAYAQEMRMDNSYADLTFSGTTANCYVDIAGDARSDKISATIELRCGSQSIKTWNKTVDGHLRFSDSVDVSKGNTYELVVDYTVNGKPQTQLSDSGTCN